MRVLKQKLEKEFTSVQSSDPSVTIGTKFSHFQESSSECDSLQTWASLSASFLSHRILQIHLAAVSPPLQQHVIELEVVEEAGAGWERGHTDRREGLMLWRASGEQPRWREGLERLGGGQQIACGH